VEAPESIPQRDVYSVSRLNREARNLLEGRFPLIWVEGEISNLARPSSGHLYFSLKDAAAQVRCAMFRGQNRRRASTVCEAYHGGNYPGNPRLSAPDKAPPHRVQY